MLVVLLLTWAGPGLAPVAAQVLEGRVVEERSNEPVSGAMVVAEGRDETVLGRTLTDDAGRFLLRLPAAMEVEALRVDRIGYRSRSFDPGSLPADGSGTLRVGTDPVRIGGLAVTGEDRCADGARDGGLIQRLWTEARKSLTVTDLSRRIRISAFEIQRYERLLDPEDGSLLSERERGGLASARKPYRTLSVEQMTRSGWIRETTDGGLIYFAPDAEVLLSREFSEQHCFGAEVDDDGIRLRFRPNRTRRGLPEIQGVLILDPVTAELTELRFGYVNLPLPAMAERHAGGEVHFYGAPNGLRVVREWSIRAPLLEVFMRRSFDDVTEDVRVHRIHVEGGRILRVRLEGEVLEIPFIGP